MAWSVLFIFTCTLFYKVSSLTCYQCIPETSIKCTETTVDCPVGQCGTMKTTSYLGNNAISDMIMKNCSATQECVTASVNFGVTKIIINNECCNTDLCNKQIKQESQNRIPNGMHCYTCKGEDCLSTLPCADGEDHCVKATVISEGQMMTMRGCATRSFCRGDLSSQISQNNTAAVGLTCCKGHLCNSSKTLIQSHMVQLSFLMCAIIHMLL
ncbi:neuromast-expressed gpi-anchored lymphocyte antigen 6 precursor [Danio rerio]|uniref:Neuromast-expressed gpi-anchored lymphocyte antigen 6 n=1 Tax=Danio rerio TaxID=7955 RepID=E7F0J8_DANRE|nr:neuromast-expressed gpi-anchored lymphocyte antigen 6 precursor [Danio rerio]|eukprot:XP_002664937.1 urokinase plasminogen activator surface receptor-like [Danio rerio]